MLQTFSPFFISSSFFLSQVFVLNAYLFIIIFKILFILLDLICWQREAIYGSLLQQVEGRNLSQVSFVDGKAPLPPVLCISEKLEKGAET